MNLNCFTLVTARWILCFARKLEIQDISRLVGGWFNAWMLYLALQSCMSVSVNEGTSKTGGFHLESVSNSKTDDNSDKGHTFGLQLPRCLDSGGVRSP